MSGWFFENMVWASAMMALVLIVRVPVARLLGAGPAYALWALPALRLVMPPLPAWGADMPSLALPLTVFVPAAEAGGAGAEAGGIAGWAPVLIVLWAAGAAAFLVWQWLAYRDFLRRLSLSSRAAGAHRGLPLLTSGSVDGPLAVGLLDRRIVVPADFAERYSESEQRLALEHERIHHVRGDIWWNLTALLVLAANWFNPLAWAAFRAFRADQELACDAAVAAAAPPAARGDYARALVKSASRLGLVAACPLNHADQLKRRLKMMNTHRSNRLRTLGGAAILVALGGAGASLGAPGLAHPHEEGKQQRIIIMEHKAEGGSARPAPGEMRSFMIRRGEGGEIALPERCNDGEDIANVDETSGERRTRVILCARGEGDSASRLQRLQEVRERMAANSEIPAEHRQRVLAALDRAIADLRARQ